MPTPKDRISAIRTLASQSTISILRTVARRTNWTLSGKDWDTLLAGYFGKLANAEDEWRGLGYRNLQFQAKELGVKKVYGVKLENLIDKCWDALMSIWKEEIKLINEANAQEQNGYDLTEKSTNKRVKVDMQDHMVEGQTKDTPGVVPRNVSILEDSPTRKIREAEEKRPNDLQMELEAAKKADQEMFERIKQNSQKHEVGFVGNTNNFEHLKERCDASKIMENMSSTVGRIDTPSLFWEDGKLIIDKWNIWRDRLDIYYRVSKLDKETEEEQILRFEYLLGSKGLKLYRSLSPKGKTLRERIEVMNNYFNPKETIDRKIVKLLKANQVGTPADFARELRNLAEGCELGEAETKILRGVFLKGLRSDQIRSELLIKDYSNFEEMIERARVLHEEGASSTEKLPVKTKVKRETESWVCQRCGYKHYKGSGCSAENQTCKTCGKLGHFSRICKTKKVRSLGNDYNDGWDYTENANYKEKRDQYQLRNLTGAVALREILVFGVETKVLIDCGAQVSCLNKATIQKIGVEKKIKETDVQLRGFNGSPIGVIGEIQAEVEYRTNGKRRVFSLAVVEEGQNVMGIYESVELGMIKFDEGRINNKGNINMNYITKGADINFLGNFKFNLHLKPGVIPHMAKERPIPYGMRSEVKKQLDKMVQDGVLVPTDQADWASPIVAIRKPNGEIRICGDFVRLNEALVADKYPLPNIEDLFAELGPNNKWFAKIDLESAYH